MLDSLLKLESEYTAEDAEWDAFVNAHPNGSILQLSQWATLKGRFGWSSQRVWMRQEGKLVAGAQLLFRSVGWRMVTIGYCPHGPLVNWQDEEQTAVLLNQIDQACYRQRASLVKLEPNLWQTALPNWEKIAQEQGCTLEADTIQPPRTVLVDISDDDEAILKRMKSKTRYNIRLAGRKEVTVREGTLEDIAIFNRLIQTTGQRNKFGVHAPEYYQAAYELLAPDHLNLLIAEYEGQPLAAFIISAVGKRASYLYGASSNEERNRMPTYLLHWEAIRWAKSKGCTEYDLWGVPDEDEETLEAQFTERHDGLWGVYRAKRGWGGDVVRTVGAVERVYNKRAKWLMDWWRNR